MNVKPNNLTDDQWRNIKEEADYLYTVKGIDYNYAFQLAWEKWVTNK